MFNPLKIFKKKEEQAKENMEEAEEETEEGVEKKQAKPVEIKLSGNANTDIVKLTTELDRVKVAVESFGEVRKGFTERISGLNEQVGELRAMILDRDRTIQELELKAIKAADLVESVQPDKLMIELQREDAKFEALKANLEGNEAIMDRIMDEIREMRKKLAFFRGIDEIVKLGEEVRKELLEIKKVEAVIHVDTDKVETIHAELKRKFQEIDLFNDSLQELKANLEQSVKDVDSLKGRVTGLASKDELDRLAQRVQRYIDALQEINKESSLSKDVVKLKSMLEGLK